MYKIVGVGRNNTQIELAEEKEVLTFPSEDEAVAFINKITKEGKHPGDYRLIVEKLHQ